MAAVTICNDFGPQQKYEWERCGGFSPAAASGGCPAAEVSGLLVAVASLVAALGSGAQPR